MSSLTCFLPPIWHCHVFSSADVANNGTLPKVFWIVRRDIIGTRHIIGRLFELENLRIPSTSNLCVVSSPSTLHLWHHHLAHSSLENLHPLVSKGVLGQTYSDADCAGNPIDRCSTTGYCLFLGDSLISWRAKKQIFTTRSSTEAEYHALINTTAEVVSLHWLLEDLGALQSSPTDVYCDNLSVIQIAYNDVF
ncbi:uncharacterized protein [Arachis hypogaea]|uniref:uncharacterized protein n=1 Tax=Arachis hypogaea TaxID=3818 RepID=UPI000DECFA28|nr:uncharacterized protein LOC112776976 [Arachis hypogaea]